MPRQARKESSTGIFHVMMHGINHQNRRTSEKEEDEFNIFEDEEDRQLERLTGVGPSLIQKL